VATTADNFNAAAIPIIKAMIEKSARINPFLNPCMHARMMSIARTRSMSIFMNYEL
jgi:hypothetical protein